MKRFFVKQGGLDKQSGKEYRSYHPVMTPGSPKFSLP
jgi:hypothetical protein